MKHWIPSQLTESMSDAQKGTWTMRAFGLAKVPLLFLASPSIVRLDDSTCEVLIPFRKIVKNHLGSMYFGALAIGADTCVGMLAMHQITQSGESVSLVFKDFQINFLKRAVGPTTFVCNEGPRVKEMLASVLETGERFSEPMKGQALCHGEVVAEFTLTLSLKKR